jgi:hypothetical protein
MDSVETCHPSRPDLSLNADSNLSIHLTRTDEATGCGRGDDLINVGGGPALRSAIPSALERLADKLELAGQAMDNEEPDYDCTEGNTA